MWSRRTFLQHGSLALAAFASLEAHGAQAQLGPLKRLIGLQLYAVREDVAKDLPGTLKTVASIGYREVELFGVPTQPASSLKRMLQAVGLTAPSMHSNMEDMQANMQQRIEYATAVGAEYLVISFPWTKDSRFKNSATPLASGITMDDWKWNAEQLNRIGAAAQKAGIRLGYHNHNIEFRAYDGAVAFDQLLRQTDPSLVSIELDIGWVVAAGADPMAYLKQHADRISMLHVKDVRKGATTAVDHIESQTTEVGSGQIDWRQLFAAMDANKIRHYFIEQENFERPPLQAAKISFDYLTGLKNVTGKA
jgi:sugar phosphate isomerase/epimerase